MSEQLLKTPCTFGENGNFLLERELGSGGMGGVYMGRDKMLDRPVAVKVMLKEYGADAEFVERFKKEAQAAAKLIHPNIAQIYSYGISDGMPYIAMELVAGGSLWTVMQAGQGKADVTRVLKICQQVAQALQCSTDQGFVHGDIKPENILLDANGNAKLVDFGLAGMQKDTDEIWGTPYYIAPEKVQQAGIDFRADMYNLGGTLYHALTNKPPFDGADVTAVVKARFSEVPKKPSEIRPDLTPAVDALVMRMLEQDKEKRFPSFEALIEEFKKVLTSGLESKSEVKVGGDGEGQKAASPAGTKTVRRTTTIRAGRRMSSVRKRTSVVAPTDDPEKPKDPEADGRKNEDEEEGGGNLGLKVTLSIVGGVLLIGAVIGGLIWFQYASKKSEAAAYQAQIAEKVGTARSAVANNRAQALKFADEFDEFANKAVMSCKSTTDELKKLLPDWADEMQPPPSKELLDAIASTNEVAAAPAPAPHVTEWANLDDAHYIGGAKVTAADTVGKFIVIFRWSAKDEASVKMLAELQTNKDAFDSKFFIVLGSHGSKYATKDEAKKALDGQKINLPVFEDVGAKYGEPKEAATMVPFIYIVDEKGNIRYQGQDLHRATVVATELLTKLRVAADEKKDAAAKPDDKSAKKGEKKDAPKAEEKKSEPEKPAEPAKQRPPVLDDMKDLWDRAYSCQASAIRIRHQARKLVKQCDAAEEIKNTDEASMKQLAEIANKTTEAIGELRMSKDVENVKKGISYIKDKGDRAVKGTVKRLRIEKLEADRKAAKEKEIADEKAKQEAAAAAKAKLIEDESAAAKDKFETLVAQGVFIQLDWESALRQLKQVKESCKTPEGGFVAATEIRKVEAMKMVQGIFKENLPGYTFRRGSKKASIKGNTVRKADDSQIEMVRADKKTVQKLTWRKLYKEYHGNLDELISTFVVKGRENGKKKLSLRGWADAMSGAALTMRIICGDSPSAASYGEKLVKQVYEAYPDYQKNLKAMFPDITLGGEEEAAAEEKPEGEKSEEKAE